ncbi:FRG domain-containing protein [Coraliomargarita parva]|uniref:FRG domain-containing protein n=1 Tax=Coraliomargarita parva TaxID=3014050 RepID=UPI0022B54FD4|nr:FRG domain-containing protein [Coraliomargarita parva]
MKIKKARSVMDGFQRALEIASEWSNGEEPFFWFRGVVDNTYDLLPGAHWRSIKEAYDEYEPLVTFSQEAVAYADVGYFNDWKTYFLAQHHGIPTRLLDWTESFSAAMFFALDGAEASKTPCVWLLRPHKLNGYSIKWDGILCPENIRECSLWLPKEQKDVALQSMKDPDGYLYDKAHPLAIYPSKSNKRLIAQQGAFTVHGTDQRPLEKIISEEFSKPEEVLARIDFEGLDLKQARHDLQRLGVRRSSIYPDIDNFVKELKEQYWPDVPKHMPTKTASTKSSPKKKAIKKKAVKKVAKKVVKKMIKKAAKKR